MTFTIRPREDWQSASQPVVGPSMVLGTVTMLPAHYTAASTIPADIPSYLRSIQNDYTVNRGYSIGYNFAIDQTGTAWELRGFDIKCAANKGMNEVTIAVLCLVDGAEAMNPAMTATFQALAAEAQWTVGIELLIVGHRDIGSTACPGDGIYGQVVSGALDPATTPDPIPTPLPPEAFDMDSFLIRHTDHGWHALVYGDGKVTGIDNGNTGPWVARFGEPLPAPAPIWDDFTSK